MVGQIRLRGRSPFDLLQSAPNPFTELLQRLLQLPAGLLATLRELDCSLALPPREIGRDPGIYHVVPCQLHQIGQLVRDVGTCRIQVELGAKGDDIALGRLFEPCRLV